jgi:transcriptional regulator with XRE-family HTH domain
VAWKRAGDLGVRLRALREALELTQEAFAEMMGVVDQSVSDYENARSKPSKSRLERLARQLQVPVSVFSEGGPSPTVALERARMPQEPSTTGGGTTRQGRGRRKADQPADRMADLEAAGARAREQLADYTRRGESPPRWQIIAWFEMMESAATPPDEGDSAPPPGPRAGP